MKDTTVQMEWDEWIETFNPEMENDALKQYWQEPILDEMQKQNRVWTMLDADGVMSIGEGRHFVNRMYYIITEKPYNPDSFYFIVDQEDIEAANFTEKVIQLLLDRYGIGANDVGGEDRIEGDRYDGLNPKEYVEWIATKYDLVRIDGKF